MPNGDPSFDLEDLERYFAPIGEAIGAFARRHNLLLDRYYHDTPAWFLRFRHPLGGDASISVARHGEGSVRLSSTWHVDDYDRLVRTVRWREPRSVSRDETAVAAALREELETLLSAPSDHWRQRVQRFPRSRRGLSRSEQEAMRPRYPNPVRTE